MMFIFSWSLIKSSFSRRNSWRMKLQWWLSTAMCSRWNVVDQFGPKRILSEHKGCGMKTHRHTLTMNRLKEWSRGKLYYFADDMMRRTMEWTYDVVVVWSRFRCSMVPRNPSDELIPFDDDDPDGSMWWMVGVCVSMICLFVFGANQYDLDTLCSVNSLPLW